VRIAHITDMHIAPGGPSTQDLARAFRDVQARRPKIDLIINTGDCVGDSLGATKDSTQAAWDAFTGVVKAEVSLPIYHAIGNHDVWGWGLPPNEQKSLSSDPLFGKGFALQELGLANRYYTFDNAGWRFLVLDSTHLPPPEYPEYAEGQSYIGELDDEQYNWLVQQLEATPQSMPVCIASHIPILSACELLDGPTEFRGNWLVPGAWVHIDARRLWALFWQHRNVKLCLSGHTHQVEDVRYHGVKYLSDGSIAGPYMDFPPGYVIVNLYKDGSSDSEFVEY
jgi:3',5'-cyclic AMP phosphodiesterase CpdA